MNDLPSDLPADVDVHRVRPALEPLSAVVQVPGSKSVANRALVCAALADGTSRLSGVAPGDDTAAMLDCLQALGVGVSHADELTVPDEVLIDGTGGRLAPGPATLPARLAGTTSRFVTALAALGAGPFTIDGLPPLRSRPMTPLHDALAALGAHVSPGERWGHLPVTVGGPLGDATADGGPAYVAIRGDVSSQYITALMMIGPYLPHGLRIELTTPLVSRSYLGITAAVMASFGVDGVEVGDDVVTVPAGRYRATDYTVEPDASSASYPLAAAAIVGGTVHVPGLTQTSLQGDARFADVLGEMGCDVVVNDRGTTVTREGPLRGLAIDMVDLSDLVPTLAVVAPFAHTPTTIRGVGFIRGKESDRLGDLCRELRAAGVRATETDDGLVVAPGHPHGARLGTHHDHRLAMSFGLLGLVADGIEIEDPAVVSKSWPDFWQMLEELA
ncbi:MAG: 3-phosphoshikimate 1-carboxyvinyltransferase [Actinobacteria bacterium]|nr:3-phosphoshikimate 1-carboxyvinyltransferase [Actinomycetota bacterium]